MRDIKLKDLLLAFTCTGFIMILGAGIYEQLTIHAKWAQAPPRSLYIFQGTDGIDISVFWKLIHPLLLLLFTATLIMNWKTARRRGILITFLGYALILAATAIYFVPELIKLTGYSYSNSVLPELQHRATVWVQLNIARTAIIFLLALYLLLHAFKTEKIIS